ncbi:MAG TPA: pyruvate formate lyase family protein [bacterium]|nr:pyruvate formate lyase family protein [bacterium]
MSRPHCEDRIARIRERYRMETPFISIQRARLYTESRRETDREKISAGSRVALAMKNVFEKMDIHVDEADRIAGAWTENYVGIPIDIERGLFNQTLEVELDAAEMAKRKVESALKFARFAARNYSIPDMVGVVVSASKFDVPPPSLGSATIDKRRVNPYRIRSADRIELLEDILPYWRGKTAADIVRRDVAALRLCPDSFSEFIDALPATAREVTIISPAAAIGTWQGHLILDYETAMSRGLLAMREDVEDRMRRAANGSVNAADFLRAAKTALDGAVAFAERLSAAVEAALNRAGASGDARGRAFLSQSLADCRVAPLHPARSFRQAVQSFWTLKNISDLAMPFNVHAPGRLDQIFLPYFKRDIERGEISGDEAREILEELFLKVMSHNMRPGSSLTAEFTQRYEGSEPVTLGGLTRSGEDATNELTYIMLEAAERSKASLNFVVRLHPRSPEKLCRETANIHSRCVSSVSMMNDEICFAAMAKSGFSEEDANDYAITGCVDMAVAGRTGGEGFSSILLCRALDMALRNGDTKTAAGIVKGAGLRTGAPGSFKSFEQLLGAFFAQLDNEIVKIAAAARARDAVYARILPAPNISLFLKGTLDSMKDMTEGGADGGVEGVLLMSSVANVTDSLFTIKKLVFERGLFSLSRLIRAMDDNFKGHRRVRTAVLSLPGKWGNGNPESDDIARSVTNHIFGELKKHKTYKGGFLAPFINSMTAHTIDGRMSLATPDGRRAGMPFAASCNPYNVEKNGPTGVLKSIAAIDFTEVLGCAANIRLHPSAIGGSDETRDKWISLIKTYFRLGGEQLQPTVASAEMLRRAQKNPGAHRDIIVKVGGYSAYFTELGREIQNEIISRSEHS